MRQGCHKDKLVENYGSETKASYEKDGLGTLFVDQTTNYLLGDFPFHIHLIPPYHRLIVVQPGRNPFD